MTESHVSRLGRSAGNVWKAWCHTIACEFPDQEITLDDCEHLREYLWQFALARGLVDPDSRGEFDEAAKKAVSGAV